MRFKGPPTTETILWVRELQILFGLEVFLGCVFSPLPLSTLFICVFKEVRMLLGSFLSTCSDWHHWVSHIPRLGHKLLVWWGLEKAAESPSAEGGGGGGNPLEYNRENWSEFSCWWIWEWKPWLLLQCNLVEQVLSSHSQNSSVPSTDMAYSRDEYLPQQ